MSSEESRGAPSGFWLAVPPGWVSLDVDPSTSAASIRRLVAAAAAANETVAANRQAMERMLIGAAREAANGGIRFVAAYYEPFGGIAVQASVTVGIHVAAEGTGFSSMLTELRDAEGGRAISVVDLDAGPAVLRTGPRRSTFPGTEQPLDLLTHQFYLPAPGGANLLAAIAFASPNLDLTDDLVALFDSMASTFTFTWEDARTAGGRRQG